MIGARRTLLTKHLPYVGPGDLVSGAIGFYSTARAYSAAFAASKGAMMDIVDSAGINLATIRVLKSGYVDLATLNAWIAVHGTASISQLYDQTGNGNHQVQATVANMPTIGLNALGKLPGAVFVTANAQRLLSSGTITQAQPISFATVAQKTTNNTASFIGSNGNPPGFCAGTANLWEVTSNGTNVVTQTATDGVSHAGQALLNSTSSIVSIDGNTSATGNALTTGYAASNISLGSANGVRLTGTIMEAMLWAGDKSASFSALNANAHGSIGYNF
jgi:hypothetical protein